MGTTMTTTGLAVRDGRGEKATSAESTRAVATVPWMSRIEEHPSWDMLSQMRIKMRAQIALNHFKVRDLLMLKEGQVFESLFPDTEDVPLKIGRVHLGWGEFEAVEQRMALRLTRLV